MTQNGANNSSQINTAQKLEYKQLFDTTCNAMYFSTLSKIILKNYSLFENIFGCISNEAEKHLSILNKARRLPGHHPSDDAEGWTWNDFKNFRSSMTWLEDILAQIE